MLRSTLTRYHRQFDGCPGQETYVSRRNCIGFSFRFTTNFISSSRIDYLPSHVERQKGEAQFLCRLNPAVSLRQIYEL